MRSPERESQIIELPKSGEFWQHRGGGIYRVEQIILSADGYETTGELPQRILYTQLQDGEVCKAGQRYVRSIEDFLNNFTKSEEK